MKQLLLLCLLVTSCLYAQEVPAFAYITKNEWEQCERFMRTQAPEFFQKEILFIPPQAGLPFPIEKDPVSGYVFIHLKGKPKAFIGKGCNKKISKSILYDEKEAFVVARCEANKSGNNEAFILNIMKDVPSISYLYAMIPRQNDRCDLFVEYGNKGDLAKAAVGQLELSTKDLLLVLSDLNSAILGMHRKGYIHRDIKKTNAFLYTKKGRYHAMMGDVSFAIPIKSQPNGFFCVPDENTPPEIYQKPFCNIDRLQAETYSLGIIFYMLILEKKPPWTHLIRKCLVPKLSQKEKRERLKEIQESYETCRKQGLKKVDGTRKKAAELMFEMIDPNPDNRPSLAYIQKELVKLME